MSMALALEYTQEWFRDKYSFKVSQCGVQPQAQPPLDAMGPFYIAIDDAGVQTGNEQTHSLKEILTITVGIWRKMEHFSPKILRGNLKLPQDKYLAGAFTLAEMERKVIVRRSGGEPLYGLHFNYDFVNGINARYALPHETLGANFVFPFQYKGRGQMEELGYDVGAGDPILWSGYRLRFSGLAREQKLTGTTPAIG